MLPLATPNGLRTVLPDSPAGRLRFNERGDLILARLKPSGYEEIARTHVLNPDVSSSGGGRKVIWSHPAFANRCVYARNDHEMICVLLAARK